MLSKQVLKDIQRLGLKKGRAETGLFVAEGPKVVAELLAAIPQQVEGVYALPSWIETHRSLVPPHLLHEVNATELSRISQLQTPNEVLLVAQQWEGSRPVHPLNALPGHPSATLRVTGDTSPGASTENKLLQDGSAAFPAERSRSATGAWILYLDTIQDPGNLGTIIRIADWFGIHDIVCSAGCAEAFNPKVVQSTMASLARVNVWYDETGDWLQTQEVPVLAAALDGVSIYDYDAPRTGILLIGNESKGLQPALLARATQKITIPRIGGAESLNAAVAAGIIVSHLMRDDDKERR
ncbi:MAG: RNA methyltransferase [Chitinophagaceae bacterium]|nr:MAG: RNA methyltransferase [Chitinophagaceae bacterium]